MVKQNPYTEGVLAALTALIRAINDANYEVEKPKKTVVKKIEDVYRTYPADFDYYEELKAEKGRLKALNKQTNLKQFDDTKPFEVAPWNNRQYRCSGCGMYGHTMANKNRPCKGRY